METSVCSAFVDDRNPELTVQLGAVDTHCHLFLLDREPSGVVEAAKAAGVDRLICVGVDPETSRRSLELADSIEGVFATAGMHPHDAEGFDAEAARRIEELLADPRVIGVGECGLDFFRMRSPAPDQIRCLRTHIALSNDVGKPMVVHVREAWPDVLRVLDEGSAERVVIHCFSGDAQIARECAERGYWISFAGQHHVPEERTAAAGRGRTSRRSHPHGNGLAVPLAAEAAWFGQRAREHRAHHRRACACSRRIRRDIGERDGRERAQSVPRSAVRTRFSPSNIRSLSRLQ